MDELDQLTGARPEPTPTPEVVAAHRDALRAAIGGARAGAAEVPAMEVPVGAVDGPRSPRSPRRWLAAAAAVVVVAGAGIALAARRDGPEPVEVDGSTTTAASPPAATAPTGPAASTTCGALPFELALPDGFQLVAETATSDGRLELVYEGPGGSLEVSWPGEVRRGPRTSTERGVEGGVISVVEGPEASTFDISATGFGTGTAPCDLVTARVVAADDAVAGALGLAFQDSLLATAAGPLVAGDPVQAAELPAVGRCESPSVPNVGAPVDGAPAGATPSAALEAFLAGRTQVVEELGIEVERPLHPTSGYRELHLPDGRVAFAHTTALEGAPPFTGTLFVVEQTDAGWAVTSWEASGC